MQVNWPKKYGKCQKCGTTRYKHVAKGLCARCHNLVKKLDQVNRWNIDDEDSLRGFPISIDRTDLEGFSRIKTEFVSQIAQRLEFLKAREQKLDGDVLGIDVEYQLRRIAQRCRMRNKYMFFGIADFLEGIFDMNQRRELFRLFNEIEEGIRWKGVNWVNNYLRRYND